MTLLTFRSFCTNLREHQIRHVYYVPETEQCNDYELVTRSDLIPRDVQSEIYTRDRHIRRSTQICHASVHGIGCPRLSLLLCVTIFITRSERTRRKRETAMNCVRVQLSYHF